MTIKKHGGIFGRNPSYNNITVSNAITAKTISTDGGRSFFAANSEPFVLYLRYNNTTSGAFVGSPAADEFQVSASSGASRLRIDASGNVSLPAGNLVVSSGKGIDFSATAGTGTSELFDDYEEGTWTPAYTASSGGAATYNAQNGSYTKIGNKVTVIGELQAKRNTLSGNITVSGLPFSHSGNGGGMFVTFAINFATDMPNLRGYATGTTLSLRKQATDSAGSTNVTQADLSDSATNHNYIYFTAIYLTA
jgi:hypothetical protein